MRQWMGFCSVLLLSCLAAGQATVISGSTNNWTPPGMYATQFVPLVATPSVSVGPVSLSTGASNGTGENLPGATNATLSVNMTGPGVQVAQPVWYGTMVLPEMQVETSAEFRASEGSWFEFGAAIFESSYGAAQLMVKAGPREHAARVYTNQDVEGVNTGNGVVKFRGKTEHVE